MTKSLNLSRGILQENHLGVAIALVSLGHILLDKGDFNEAVVHLESGVSILREKLPNSHFTATGLYDLAFAALKRNQLTEAYNHATQSLRLHQYIYPNNHKYIVYAQELLHKIKEKLSTSLIVVNDRDISKVTSGNKDV
ncbi:uncharacterized protein LOC134181283 [Corticium candelabrum]|uniref:uncharacterized protein LOC134181283 n=1 Tax=Corticium candelabrum TaxID=121492 RepID=UPI002E2524E5|nr:uncharacterized protein LOC134181283 [Corticium candelabrum]